MRFAIFLLLAAIASMAIIGCGGSGSGGFIKTSSGIQYSDVRVGKGMTPLKGEVCKFHYAGWLTNGVKFDSSYDRNEPFEFTLGGGEVIQGWEELASTMRAGGKRRAYIPPELAYGSEGRPPLIPRNATLYFEMELLEIQTPGEVTTESGLKYADLYAGDGKLVESGDNVLIHYSLWLSDGTKLESTHDTDSPISFTIGNGEVIKGLEDGVVGMRSGGRRKLTVPPSLAYGEQGNPQKKIPPNATLIYEVEVLGVH
ncbi:MAG: FKBP-type peptidyl-prolyl cis-trans isomerase [Armatimonadota bacterium]|nr:FKBP-type peptidyl-prolyl cis-trans isomerase [Armatimonadota bacterium]